MHIAIIGTGIVGVATAGWLQRDGHKVTFIDPKDAGEACSFGNAGRFRPVQYCPWPCRACGNGCPNGCWTRTARW